MRNVEDLFYRRYYNAKCSTLNSTNFVMNKVSAIVVLQIRNSPVTMRKVVDLLKTIYEKKTVGETEATPKIDAY